jgi:hypothetical protein
MKPGVWQRFLRHAGFDSRFPAEYDIILTGITSGVDIGFTGDRENLPQGSNLKSASEAGMEQRIGEILAQGVAAGKLSQPSAVPQFEHMAISPIGQVPKRGGKIRVIHHLSYPRGGDSINAHTDNTGQQELGTIGNACKLIRAAGAGCSLVKVDIEAAYKQVPVRPEDWPLLGFKWLSNYYHDKVLPFGLKSSCRIWEYFATALHYLFVHMLGIPSVVHYIDDFLIIASGSPQASSDLHKIQALCESLGIPLAPAKTEGPATILTFLGIQLDTVKMECRLDKDRLDELNQLLQCWREKETHTLDELESITGKLSFAASVVRPGKPFLRRLYSAIAWIKRNTHSSALAINISDSTREDLDWWTENLASWNGTSMMLDLQTDSSDLHLATDASESGFGAVFGKLWMHGEWPAQVLRWAGLVSSSGEKQQTRSMPFLELYSLVLAASTWGHLWQRKYIRFFCDCEPVVYAANKQSSKAANLQPLLRYLAALGMRHHFFIKVWHVAGVLNVGPDLLSRGLVSDFEKQFTGAVRSPTASTPIPLPPLASM